MTAPPPTLPDGETPGSGWMFPLREAVAATRSAFVAGASALSLVLLALLGALGVALLVARPDAIVWWTPLALVPLALCSLAAWRWDPIPAAGYAGLAVVATGAMALLTVAAAASPLQAPGGTASFMLSMTTNVVVLIGASSDRWTGGIAGALGGLVLAEGTQAIVGSFVGLQYRVDVPPLAIAGGIALGYALSPLVRRRARREAVAFDDADARTRVRQVREIEGRESAAQLHDTLLGTLAALAHREAGPLGDVERERIAASLDASALLPVLRGASPRRHGEFTSRLTALGAAGGVRVQLEGELAALEDAPGAAGEALRAAVEQCVTNVVRHARVEEAWVSVVVADTTLSVTIVDEGIGFDPDAVPRERMGLSVSVHGRMERHGGTVRLWSAPGAGTSVLLTIPAVEEPS